MPNEGRTEKIKTLEEEKADLKAELRKRGTLGRILEQNPLLSNALTLVLTGVAASTFGVNLGQNQATLPDNMVSKKVATEAINEASTMYQVLYQKAGEDLRECRAEKQHMRDSLNDTRDSLRLCADRLTAVSPRGGHFYGTPDAAPEEEIVE
jgi:hypothetical protein